MGSDATSNSGAAGASAPRLVPRQARWRGLLAALAVGWCGGLATPAVWVLALSAGVAFGSLARRDAAEPAAPGPDRLGGAMQLAFLLILCLAAWDSRLPRAAAQTPTLAEISGLALIATGWWLRRSAAQALGRHFTVKLIVGTGHPLVSSGPYRVLRHPNYAGLALIAVGTALGLGSLLALLATALLWLPLVVARTVSEERLLERELGSSYAGYASRTWRLVPGVF